MALDNNSFSNHSSLQNIDKDDQVNNEETRKLRKASLPPQPARLEVHYVNGKMQVKLRQGKLVQSIPLTTKTVEQLRSQKSLKFVNMTPLQIGRAAQVLGLKDNFNKNP